MTTIRNVSLAFLFAIGTMTSSCAFVSPHPKPVFMRSGPLYDIKGSDPENSPESAPVMPNDGQSSSATFKSIGIDEEFVPFPHRDYSASDVVQMCMDSMSRNNDPYHNAGLEVCFNFSTDRCRAAQGGSLEMFVEYAHNPIFASMVDAPKWEVISTGPIIQGTLTRGAMQTVLVDVHPRDGGEVRRFLWTLQQERRPPRQECWLVWECLFVDNAISHTL